MYENAIHYIEELFKDNAGGHDVGHTLRVYRNAMLIAETEPEADPEIVALAALLHDADDHKLFATVNNANARSFLVEEDIPGEKIEEICSVINAVSFSRNRGRIHKLLLLKDMMNTKTGKQMAGKRHALLEEYLKELEEELGN